MSENYDIIVIGAGCGGLTAAACAAKEGKKVLLLERHNTPGGFTSSFVRGRFEFDISLHRLCGFGKTAGLGEARQIFEYLGISNKIQWVTVPEAYRILTKSADSSKIDATMPLGVENYIDAMEEYVPNSKASMTALFKLAEEVINSCNTLTCDDMPNGLKGLHKLLKEHGNFVRTAPYSVNSVLDALNVPKKAQEIFEAFWLYLGVDCNRLSFVHYISTVYSYLAYGAFIPKMRSYEICMALAGVIEDNGGEIRYNSHVSRILFKDGQAAGVILKNGEKIKCNHIICNGSPTTAYGKLIKANDVPKTALKRTNARTLGMKGAVLYLGLNRSPQDLGITNYTYIITDTANSANQYELMKSIDTNNAQIAVCLNIADSAASPVGTTVLCITALYSDNCWANIEPENYFDEKDMLAARLIANFESSTGIIIHNSIEELEVATPVTFARYTYTPQGTVFGYYGDDWDSLLPRIMTEAADCDTKGLRFCGGWGTQLSGVGSSIVSGRNTAFATMGDINKDISEVLTDEKTF